MGSHIENIYRPATFDYMENAGTRIRAMRKALEWNQEDLAEKIGVDQSTVSDIERGAGFSADVLMRLAFELGASAELIMSGHDSRVWPFPHIPFERFLALGAEHHGFVEGKLSAALDECERYLNQKGLLRSDERATVRADSAGTSKRPIPDLTAHQVERRIGMSPRPVLEKALIPGETTHEGSKAGRAQKPRARRGM